MDCRGVKDLQLKLRCGRGGGGGGGRAKDVARVNNVARRLKNIAWTVTGICCAHDVQEGL